VKLRIVLLCWDQAVEGRKCVCVLHIPVRVKTQEKEIDGVCIPVRLM